MNRRKGWKPMDPATMTPDALAALESTGFSRRDLLKGIGALIVGFSASPEISKLAAQNTGTVPRVVTPAQVDSWVAIFADETVTGYSGKCEFGQGFRTVQYQLIAEELGVPIERVKLIICDTFLTPDQGVTSGSQSHPVEFGPNGLRQALATAREALFQMASELFRLPMDELVVNDGVISPKSDPARQMSYGRLIGGKQFSMTLNPRAAVKDPAKYTVLGTSVPRYEIPGKVTGEFQYVQHVRVPGMLHGKVVRPPAVGVKVVNVDESSVRGLPGNVRVVVKNDFVGVVADKEWQALKAAQALRVTWTDSPTLPNQAELYEYMRRQPTRDAISVLSPDVDQMFTQAARTVRATYLHPYQMHGSLGASCGVADVRGSGSSATATIWSSTQGVYPQRDSAANLLGIPRENVRVIFVEGSGCYGINGADTVCFDAALMSQAVGRPVRVQFTRKDEMAAGENYGPAYIVDLRTGLDAQGQMIVWNYESWVLSRGGRPNANNPGNIITGALAGFATPAIVPAAGTPPTNYSNNNNTESSYGAGCVGGRCAGTGTIRSERILTHTISSPFFTGPLRSPNRLQNTFANESFIDEVAAALQTDPVQYRLRHLSDQRMIDVLNGAAGAANWDTRPSPKPGNSRTGVVTGRGIGLVLYEGNNGYCALVAEVSVDQASGQVTVTRMVTSQDSGPVSNPDGLRQQMEGGALQGMSRALREEVRWNDRAITSVDWRTYPVYGFGEPLPVIETVLIDRPDVPHMGAGECTITIVAAAIANAIFDATGARIRQVPFTAARVRAALAARG